MCLSSWWMKQDLKPSGCASATGGEGGAEKGLGEVWGSRTPTQSHAGLPPGKAGCSGLPGPQRDLVPAHQPLPPALRHPGPWPCGARTCHIWAGWCLSFTLPSTAVWDAEVASSDFLQGRKKVGGRKAGWWC